MQFNLGEKIWGLLTDRTSIEAEEKSMHRDSQAFIDYSCNFEEIYLYINKKYLMHELNC